MASLAAGCAAEPLDGDTATESPSAYQPGPLEQFLGFGAFPESVEEVIAETTWRENLTAQCMAELGFEYLPVVPAPSGITFTEGPVRGTREFVELHGYGIWDSPRDEGGAIETEVRDPNWERRESMSEAEREAWDVALHGPVTERGEDGSVSYAGGGCSEAATVPSSADQEYLTGVRQEAIDYLTTLAEDPRFDEVDADWASCMADAGFDDHSPLAAQQRFWDEFLAETADGVGPERDLVAERAAGERTVALADLECQEATDWVSRHRAIEVELQQEYVDAHRADLEALLTAMESVTRGD